MEQAENLFVTYSAYPAKSRSAQTIACWLVDAIQEVLEPGHTGAKAHSTM